MSRNLVICCDGTNNELGTHNTNVVRLIQSLERDPERQLIYYDPGVGTLPEPGFASALGKRWSEIVGLAFGTGLVRKVGLAYAFLMGQWKPGDQVFLFGFSRGAYSVRALASLLHVYGLLPAGNENLLPYVLRMFAASRRQLGRSSASAEAFWRHCDEFRETFAQAIPERDGRRFPVDFLGAWDTVSSVGWVWDPQQFPFTRHNPSIRVIRHAVALDERRAFFRQNLFGRARAAPDQDLLEVWFPGVHADVGGGYPESDGGLWREPFVWMLEQARSHGLLLDERRMAEVLNRFPIDGAPWAEPQHESLGWKWWPAEFFPKLSRRRTRKFRLPRFNLGRARAFRKSAWVHPSVVNRLLDSGHAYAPRALRGIDVTKLKVWSPPASKPAAAEAIVETVRSIVVPAAATRREDIAQTGESGFEDSEKTSI